VGQCLAGAGVRRALGLRCHRRRFLEECPQGRAQGLLHHHLVAIGRDHSFQLGQLAGLRTQVKRRDIENRALDGHDLEMAADDARTHLVPQRNLLGDLCILLDARLDLERPVDQLVLRESVDDQFAVVRWIATRRQPRDHVLAPAGHHRQHEDKFGARLRGQPYDHVVRRHRHAGGAPRLDVGLIARELPEILAVIEDLRRFHVVGAVGLRLNQEQILRVADVLLQVLRHCAERPEQARENALVRPHDGVGRIAHIEVGSPVVRIDHHLDCVADVVVAFFDVRLGIGVPAAGGVGILDPVEPPAARDDVGGVVQGEVRRDRANAVLDVAMEQNSACGRDVTGHQDVGIVELPGEEGPQRHAADGDTVASAVARIGVLVALGVVEFGYAAIDDHIPLAAFAEIQARLLDDRATVGNRRNILQVKGRQALSGFLRDWRHHDAIAVREQQMQVHPGLGICRKQGRLEFPSRKHHLLITGVEPVAIDVRREELVIGPDLLQLRIGIPQRLQIPQADVVDGRAIGLERGERQVLLGRERLDRDLRQTIGVPRHRNVVGDVGRLKLQLVRFDIEALE